jgi:superfamily II DNA or RNA helicase
MPRRLRQYVLDESRERVLRLGKLRPPQREAFDRVHKLFSSLDTDLPNLTNAELIEHLERTGLDVSTLPPQLVLALATGVGKTKLMGALIAYLYNANQSKNFLILAPRSTILEKLERETLISSPKYLFIDPLVFPEPSLCFRDTIESFKPSHERPNVFILSPQSITGNDKRFARQSEFRGFSLVEYLRGLTDLVVFADEAHHISVSEANDTAAGWMQAVRELHPRLYFGLTATPRIEAGSNILFSYDLATCLREGHYTKAVELIVEQRDEGILEDDWDKYTIDFALSRLERKRQAITEYTQSISSFPQVEPVLLICAKDTQHAEKVAKWLIEARGISTNQILVTHSEKKLNEQDIARLVAIDKPGNEIRIVVNVFQLTEGWDVTNVYVIAPLRAMATFRSAIQTMGRGLRLPAGRRTGFVPIDTLDVLCCGKESFQDILKQATDDFGSPDEGAGVKVRSKLDFQDETPIPSKEIAVRAVKPISLSLPVVKRLPVEPKFDFEIQNLGSLMLGGATSLHLATLERTGLEEGVEYTYEDFVASVYARVLTELEYLSDPLHGESLEALIRGFLDSLGARPENKIQADAIRFALVVAAEIDKRYRVLPTSFELTRSDVVAISDYVWRVPESFSESVKRIPLEEWR